MNTGIGKRKSYRFGNLREALVEQGIAPIHGEEIEKFFLRKATKKAGVSAAVYCNYLGNMDDLPREMYSYMINRSTAALKQAVEDNPYHHVIVSTGAVYVELLAGYPHYFNFLFDSKYLDIQTKKTKITWNSSFTPFRIFVAGAKRGMRELNIGRKELGNDLLVMQATIHGLAAMANMKGVQYDSGD